MTDAAAIARCPDCKARLIPADSEETWVAWCPICNAVEPMGPKLRSVEIAAEPEPEPIRPHHTHGSAVDCGTFCPAHDPELG